MTGRKTEVRLDPKERTISVNGKELKLHGAMISAQTYPANAPDEETWRFCYPSQSHVSKNSPAYKDGIKLHRLIRKDRLHRDFYVEIGLSPDDSPKPYVALRRLNSGTA